MAIIQTSRLTLTPCSPADRADFIALEQDPDVMRYLNGGRPVGREESDPASPFLMPRGGEPHVWTARLINGYGFAGWFCLWPEPPDGAELGYRLARAAWGQGLATEGAAALAAWGLSMAGYDRITATTMAVNLASRRVMEKIGMVHVRTEVVSWPDPIPGSEHGEVWYELRRPASIAR